MHMVAVIALLPSLLGGCSNSTRPRQCGERDTQCSAFAEDCNTRAPRCIRADEGSSSAWVKITSAPTSAAIYLDERFIGYSPLRYRISFTSEVGSLSMVAVPLYAGQAQQERLIMVPALPTRISFFMNNPGSRSAMSKPRSAPVNQKPVRE